MHSLLNLESDFYSMYRYFVFKYIKLYYQQWFYNGFLCFFSCSGFPLITGSFLHLKGLLWAVSLAKKVLLLLFTSGYFAVGRLEVCGKDTHSHVLFILGLEILTCSIGKNGKIEDIQIDNSDVKVKLFSGHLPCFVRNRSSYDWLRDCLSKFSECSWCAFWLSLMNVKRKKANFDSVLKSIHVLNMCEWGGLDAHW